ncbi:MAG TPA: hypothetical protein VMR52_03940 [Dehalococcoidia bacterium]|nr:hypothetical protein [Dehalococcoidia bacterium]
MAAVKSEAIPRLQGDWRSFISHITKTKKQAGGPTPLARISHASQYLPGFSPGESSASVKVLGPYEHVIGGKKAIRRYTGGKSINTNGNSILLRVDYGRSRVLLTGDLNTKSQHSLLSDHEGHLQELECDVAKACHHGSEDVSYRFLQATHPAVTVISSGDSESHNHPRPGAIAASALTGFVDVRDDHIHSPLIYSTEMARSVSVGKPTRLDVLRDHETIAVTGSELAESKVTYEETKAGDLRPRTRSKLIGQTYVVAGVVYGLVNVRTDGERILCATMNEKNYTWDVREIRSRF